MAVTLTYATSRGHALIGRALYLPEACAADEEHRELAGIPEEVMFATKPQLAGTLLDHAHAQGIRAAFVAGDEVYSGRELRRGIRQRGMSYVLAAGGFRWDLLAGDERAQGRARLDAQYWTANVDPSDRYVQSPPGSAIYRLRTDEAGYRNLFLAGDWTNCGLNAGCIEAAVLSGLQAANAVRGRPLIAGIAGSWYGLRQVDAAPTVPVAGER